jgi:lipopolysaccharide export LptBFGC system permease protein LptF
MPSSDSYPPAPQRPEDPGRAPSRSGGFGCLALGGGAVLLMFLSVLGLCSGASVQLSGFLFVVAAVAFVAALVIGIVKLFTRS